jgi:hypothetical protein
MYADLRSVNCPGVSMKKADLTNADLRGGNFEDCNFEEACLSFVDVTEFTRESIFHFILRILNIYFWWSRFGGDYQSSDQFGPGTDPLLKRYVNRCNQRLDLKRRYRLLAPIMSLIANYGYSPMRVLFWGFVIWFSFGVLYAGISLPASLEDTWVGDALCWLSPKIDWNGQERPRHLADPFYFSLVTMTTLGYGDITPLDWKAKVYAGVEVFLGYVILALFVATVVQRMG